MATARQHKRPRVVEWNPIAAATNEELLGVTWAMQKQIQDLQRQIYNMKRLMPAVLMEEGEVNSKHICWKCETGSCMWCRNIVQSANEAD